MTETEGRVRRALSGDRSLLVSRVFPLEGIEIVSRAKGGDGRTVTAYAAVFKSPTEIHDQDGHYEEQIGPGAFDKTLADRSRKVGVFYNHARTLHGTPSEMASVPLGSPLEIRPDSRGLLTTTRYNNTQLASDVLDAIRNGDITGQSFTGVFLRSDPERGPWFPSRSGQLTTVTRQEIALIEYGPTPIPAYQDAAIIGVRNREGRMDGEHDREHDRAAGPQPYEREPGENVQCPACGKYNMPDAEYCDQCGIQLPGSAFPAGQQPYERHPDEDVQCPNCHRYNDDDAIYCDQCGQALPASAYGDDATSSSGRNPDDGRERATAALCDHFGWTPEQAAELSEADRGLLLASLGEDHGGQSRAGVDGSAWDAATAWHNGTQASNPAAFYRGICAGEKTGGDPKTQAHWALPHHYHPSDPPNAAGVRNSLSRLPQTEGLADKAQAQAHLDAHMKAIHGAEGSDSSGSSGASSSSGRRPDEGTPRTKASAAADTGAGGIGTGTPAAAVTPEPRKHSVRNQQDRKDNGMSDHPLTVEERTARLDEIGDRLREIDTEFTGAELTEQARTEWNDLLAEREDHKRAIADATSRMQTLSALADQQGGGMPGTDPGSGYAEAQEAHRAGQDGQRPGVRTTRWGVNVAQRPRNLYDLPSIRQSASSVDDLPRLYRDRARWALDEAHFPGERHAGKAARTREEIQASVEDLMMRADDVHGTIAERILRTGSPAYMRAFGKMVMALTTGGLTAEEHRALAMGTPASWSPGSYPVPYQLDPTVTLTSNGAINPLRQIARVEQIVGKEWLGVTSTGIVVTRTNEATEATDAAPTLTQPGVAPERVQAFVPFSVEVEQDWNGLLAEISMMLADAKDIEEASSFISGNGTAPNAGGVVGTLSTASLVTTAATSKITVPADLDTVEAAMAPRFRPRASWIAAKATFGQIRAAAVAAGDQFDVWARISSGTPPELIGYPAYEASAMSADLTSTTVPFLLMGDFKQFIIVDRIGMSIELVPHLFGASRMPTGQRGIYALWRNNSAILAQNAFRGLVNV